MNLQELGALLKRERERRGLSLRDVMDATKISRRNLSALEEGQVQLLPHPVYLKGYIKNYARLIGLDAERLACVVDKQCDEDFESYLPQQATDQTLPADEEFRETAPTEPAPAEPPRSPEAPATSPFMAPDEQPKTYGSDPLVPEKPKGGGMLRTFAILVVLVAALGGLLYYYQISYEAPAPPAPAPVALPAPLPVENATANATEADSLNATEAAPMDVAPAGTQAPAPGAALPGVRTGGLNEPAVAPAQPAAPASLSSIVVEKPKAPAQAAPASTQAAEARTPGMQELVITAKPGETCWVQFNDGAKSKNFTLQGGESRRLEFAKVAKVRLGNAGGVSFKVNGVAHPYTGQRGMIDVVEFGR